MRLRRIFIGLISCLALLAMAQSRPKHNPAYLGFDRNLYPGDEALPFLRKTFRFSGYWLNNPPGENCNTWAGKRSLLRSQGFGFLVLFNGRSYQQLKGQDAAALGKTDGESAAAAAKREGFPARTVIFLDQEQGGRLLDEQRRYLHAWVDVVTEGGYSTGVYCSGIAFQGAGGETVVTATDIRQHAGNRRIVYWAANDACPPSLGCAFRAAPPRDSGTKFASVWQFAQSPRRAQFAGGCRNYAQDGNCYAPGTSIFVDVDAADSTDPSAGR
jgi:hypothetical protein